MKKHALTTIHLETQVETLALTSMSTRGEENPVAETTTLLTSSLQETAAYAEVEALDTTNIITQKTTITLKNIITQMVDLIGILRMEICA